MAKVEHLVSQDLNVWIDIETTGLDPNYDLVLEVCMFITDEQDNVLNTTQVLINYPKDLIEQIISPAVEEMHLKNNLLYEIEQGVSLKEAQDILVAALVKTKAMYSNFKQKPYLCGSSIHFDRSFLKVQMPELHSLLHYRNLDVSTLVKIWPQIEEKFKAKEAGRYSKIHRAIQDIRRSFELYKFYKSQLEVK